MESVIELLELVSGRLTESAHSEVVVGEVIDLGQVKIVPLSRLSLGMGLGGGEGEGEIPAGHHHHKKARAGRGKGIGGGAGAGAKVRPVGVAIFSEDGVQVLPIADKKGILDKIFDKVPKVIELVESVMERREGKRGAAAVKGDDAKPTAA